jgi:hypothetical protein
MGGDAVSKSFRPLETRVKYGRHYPDPEGYELLNDLARRMADAVVPYLDGLSDEGRYLVRGTLGQLTTTNCWWLIYELRGALTGLVEEAELRKADVAERSNV